jgi:uncharacterized repeat protein (TIGR03803 family)
MRRIKSMSLLVITAHLFFGLLFACPALAGTEKVLWSFGAPGDGFSPRGSLIADALGNLYGVAPLGGANDTGAVFELSPDGNGGMTETVLYSFGPLESGDGQQPEGGLVMDRSGNLYGTTYVGGATYGDGGGTVFELSPNGDGTWTETVLYRFGKLPDGELPGDSLLLDANANLYGTTSAGGSLGGGTVFELTHAQSPGSPGWEETILLQLPHRSETFTGLMWRTLGLNLFGATSNGELGFGAAFRLWRNGTEWLAEDLHNFNNIDGTSQAEGNLVEDQNLNIYGTSTAGCANGTGGVWELVHNPGLPSTYQLLYSFGATDSGDGLAPQSGVIVAPDGTLYGTTDSGGSKSSAGTVFALANSPNGWQETVLYRFTGGQDGGEPVGQLLRDKQGRLYGVGLRGGQYGLGVVFRVTP